MPSERETIQQRLADHLSDHADTWNAPYGILTGLEELPRGGKVRTVSFGAARILDAVARIWRPNRIEIRGQGGLAHAVEGTYDSLDAVLEALAPIEGRN